MANSTAAARLQASNKLFYGDNLYVLREHIDGKSLHQDIEMMVRRALTCAFPIVEGHAAW